jgi:hypothetical protein
MNILVGDTGLVGSTLKESINFDFTFNSKNIDKFNEFNFNGSTIYLSCLPATKWLVNKNIKEDILNINKIINILSKQSYNKVILISTIDVYSETKLLSNEDSAITINNLSYGSNRYLFELLVKNLLSYNDLKIFRLPALYNKHIKKNVIFDLMNNNNIEQINTNSSYQWYNLDNLNDDINQFSIEFPNETTFNLFTEPIDTIDLMQFFPEHSKKVNLGKTKVEYNFTTKFNEFGYISKKENSLNDIKKFIDEYRSK